MSNIVLPIATTIDQALSGEYGSVAITYRFEWRTIANVFIMDISNAFAEADGCTIHLNNDQAVSRTADFHILTKFLPAGFTASYVSGRCVAVFADVHTPTAVFSEQLGLFHIDEPTQNRFPNAWEEWQVTASDGTIRLANRTTVTTYYLNPTVTSTAGAIIAICTNYGFTLGSWINTLPASIVTEVTWPPGTPYIQIVNDLLYGCNYYPIWADGTGILQSQPRIDPSLVPANVIYSTIAEPRMIREDQAASRLVSVSQYNNVCTITIDSPASSIISSGFFNNDPRSPLSIPAANKEAIMQLSGTGTPSTKAVAAGSGINTVQMITEIATYELQDQAARAVQYTLHTFPDPRRTNHEWYTLNIDDYEQGTLWMVQKWDLPCVPGGDMVHVMGSAAPVSISQGTIPLSTIVQHIGSKATSSQTPISSANITINIQQSTVGGNAVFVAVLCDTTLSNSITVSDSQNNIYTNIASLMTPFGRTVDDQWIIMLFTSSTTHTLNGNSDFITVTCSDNIHFLLASAYECSNTTALLDSSSFADNEETDPNGIASISAVTVGPTNIIRVPVDVIVGIIAGIWSTVTTPTIGLTVDAAGGWVPSYESIVSVTAQNGLQPQLWVELQVTSGIGAFSLNGVLASNVIAYGGLVVPIVGEHS